MVNTMMELEKAKTEYEFPEKIKKLLLDKNTKEASEELANTFLSNNHVHTIKSDDKPEMWIYEAGIYIPNGATTINEYVDKVLGTQYSTYFTNQVIAKVQVRSYITQEKLFEEAPPHLVPVNNGILNINTDKLEPFTPEYRFFQKLPVEYDPQAECPNCLKFFETTLPNKQSRNVIQELFGSTLFRVYKYHKVFIIEGYGRNGKGITLLLLQNLLGIHNCSEVSIDDMDNDSFALSDLFKKLANICGDIGSHYIKKPSLLKDLSGGNMKEANRKFKSRIQFTNYAKLIFALNECPMTADNTDGFIDRLTIVNYPIKFIPSEEIKEDMDNVKPIDTNILEKLITPEEISGLLNWALRGWHRLEKQHGFSDNKSTEAKRKLWLRKSNSVGAFVSERLEFGVEDKYSVSAFTNDYISWCRENKLITKGTKTMKSEMERHGSYKSRIDGKYYWENVKEKETKILVENVK